MPSSVSVVATEPMISSAHPHLHHAARLSPESPGHQTILCLHDGRHAGGDRHGDAQVARHFVLTKGAEMGKDGSPAKMTAQSGKKEMDMSGHGDGTAESWRQLMLAYLGSTFCRWFVSICVLHKSSEIVEVDTAKWTVMRRLPARPVSKSGDH